MSVSAASPPTRRPTRAGRGLAITAAGLILLSAALQALASLERWVRIRNAWARDDISIEDHRFDYTFPTEPWENLGSTAQLFGLAMLALAIAVPLMVRSARLRSGLDVLAALVPTAFFAVSGAHGILSGALGVPSALGLPALWQILSILAFATLVILGGRAMRSTWQSGVALLVTAGVTPLGHLFAMFLVAPVIAGYQSHDTTPWTETIIAVWTALAGVAMLAAAAWPRRG